LGGCVEPLDLSSFVKDDEVQEIVEKSAGTVYITQGSVSGLMAGNKKISGLSPGKYYMVEEWDDTGDFLGVTFVTVDGKLSDKLTDIGGAAVGEISELTNRNHYRITTTTVLPGDVPYTALNPPDSPQVAKNSGGMIILSGPEDNGFTIYTLTPPSSLASCEIIEVPFSPTGAASRVRLSQGGDIITLIDRDTIIDFIFYEYIPEKDKTAAKVTFYLLRVASDKVPDPEIPGDGDTGNLNITVNFTLNANNKTFTLNPSTLTFSQAALDNGADKTISITLTNANTFDAGSIKWTYNKGLPDEITWNGANMTIDFTEDKYIALLVIGRYTISVEATASGVAYSSSFGLRIIE
jgi:hypothetical protein